VQLLTISYRALFHTFFLSCEARQSGLEVARVPLALEIVDDGETAIAAAAIAIVDLSPDPEAAILVGEALRLRRPELPVVAAMCCPQAVGPDQLEAHVQTVVVNRPASLTLTRVFSGGEASSGSNGMGSSNNNNNQYANCSGGCWTLFPSHDVQKDAGYSVTYINANSWNVSGNN
jgi:hypothetical protein